MRRPVRSIVAAAAVDERRHAAHVDRGTHQRAPGSSSTLFDEAGDRRSVCGRSTSPARCSISGP